MGGLLLKLLPSCFKQQYSNNDTDNPSVEMTRIGITQTSTASTTTAPWRPPAHLLTHFAIPLYPQTTAQTASLPPPAEAPAVPAPIHELDGGSTPRSHALSHSIGSSSKQDSATTDPDEITPAPQRYKPGKHPPPEGVQTQESFALNVERVLEDRRRLFERLRRKPEVGGGGGGKASAERTDSAQIPVEGG